MPCQCVNTNNSNVSPGFLIRDLHGGASGLMWVMRSSSVEYLWLVPQHGEDTIGKIAILFTTLPGYRIVVK